ncbi:Hypothetical predicted protein, partial [Pelobates cultripes]
MSQKQLTPKKHALEARKWSHKTAKALALSPDSPHPHRHTSKQSHRYTNYKQPTNTQRPRHREKWVQDSQTESRVRSEKP